MTDPSRVRRRSGFTQIATAAGGTILLVCGAAAFVVNPTRHGFALLVPLANLLLGLLLLRLGWRHRSGGRASLAIGASLVVAPIVLLYGLVATLHEIGEIAVLRTSDDQATVRETRLAVLDYQGSTWIGADSGGKRWFSRLRANPRVELLRGGVPRCYIAVPVEDPEIREEVFRRIEEKYLIGRLAALVRRQLFVREGDSPETAATAIRLDPCSAELS